jgi:hypothetical protein
MADKDIGASEVGDGEGAKKPAKRQAHKRAPQKPASRQSSKASKSAQDGISAKTGILFLAAIGLLFAIYYFTNVDSNSPAGGSESQVNIILLNDVRCGAECDLTRFEGELRKGFPGASIRSVDVSSTEGSSLFQSTRVGLLPAVLFEKSVRNSTGYPQIARFVDEAGDYLSLRIGGNWDPYCDSSTQHCGEDRCAQRISCRTETPKTLDLFIMSQCPYGVQAADSMKEVLAAFKGDMQFNLHFIGQLDNAGAPMSLHGAAEVEEDLREICAEKYYPQDNKFMDYVWCRDKDLKSADWAACANGSGMDADKIRACAEGGEGKGLLSDSFRLGDSLHIFSSPTFFLNNKKLFNAVTAAEIQSAYCETNKGLPGCSKTLGNASAVPSGSCG